MGHRSQTIRARPGPARGAPGRAPALTRDQLAVAAQLSRQTGLKLVDAICTLHHRLDILSKSQMDIERRIMALEKKENPNDPR